LISCQLAVVSKSDGILSKDFSPSQRPPSLHPQWLGLTLSLNLCRRLKPAHDLLITRFPALTFRAMVVPPFGLQPPLAALWF